MSADARAWARVRELVAYAIAAISILVAFVGFQAADTASEASKFEARAVREEARAGQLLAQRDARIANDVEVAKLVNALRLEATGLAMESRRLARVGDADTAARLQLRALQADAGADALILRGFIVAYPYDDGSRVTYDVEYARTVAEDTSQVALLDIDRFSARGDELQGESLDLLAIAAVLVVAVALLTVARVVGRRAGELAAALGVVCAAAGSIWLVSVAL